MSKNNCRLKDKKQNSKKNFQKEMKKINNSFRKIDERLYNLQKQIEDCKQCYENSRNADLMIISKLENIGDFLRNNYNVVIEERERFNLYPYDD